MPDPTEPTPTTAFAVHSWAEGVVTTNDEASDDEENQP